ncbi:MAG: plasmid partitioning protein RepB C-terminal domain-containing protein [Alphaproteobacteria bacterium]|nr:plasmid partitioning protein RepB C-terminal domain-containing protein [Alphaproteobacteria bacterium]
MQKKQNLQIVAINKINILNPRERNRKIADEIKRNIEDVGLKRPITITRKAIPSDGFEYDLVCGQGRLEAYIANNQTEIPAIIVDATEEDALVMSLIENLARRQYQPQELLHGIKALRKEGYSSAEIAFKTGLTKDYINQISRLIDNGEGRLINAVESNKMPINVALQISESADHEIQKVLQDAYESNVLRGSKLTYAQELIELRRRKGKNIAIKKTSSKQLSAIDVQKMYQQEIDRKKLFIRKAEKLESTLIFIVHSLKKLFKDDNFKNLLKAESLDRVPSYLAERIKEYGK